MPELRLSSYCASRVLLSLAQAELDYRFAQESQ